MSRDKYRAQGSWSQFHLVYTLPGRSEDRCGGTTGDALKTKEHDDLAPCWEHCTGSTVAMGTATSGNWCVLPAHSLCPSFTCTYPLSTQHFSHRHSLKSTCNSSSLKKQQNHFSYEICPRDMHYIDFSSSNSDPSDTWCESKNPRGWALTLSRGLQPLMVQSGPMGQTVQRLQLGDPADPNHRLFPKPCVFPLLGEVNHGQKEDTIRPGETEFQIL